jgi:cation diffusion facilitator family transporter
MTNNHEHVLLDRSSPERYQASRRVTIVSIVTNIILTIAQIIIGIIGHSQALVADAIHTLSDTLTDFMVLFALWHGRKEADAEHPYGHARIETAVSLILGILLFAVGVGIAVRAGIKLYSGEVFVVPAMLTLWTALFTLVAKEALYRYTIRVANRYDSNMLRGNAWHHRSDALSSLIVAAGIAGSIVGYLYLDSIAAVVIAVMIMKVGVELGWAALRELIDTGLSTEQIRTIEKIITQIPEVKSLHVLRSRLAGGKAFVDVHVQVETFISVSEGHHIGEVVRQHILDEVSAVNDVMVHIDPEDDEMTAPNAHLPLRHDILPVLRQAWRGIPQAVKLQDQDITLHYVNGKLQADLVLPLQLLENQPRADAQCLAEQFAQASRSVTPVEQIALYFR